MAPTIVHLTFPRETYDAAIKWANALNKDFVKEASKILAFKTFGGANTIVSEYSASAVAAPPSSSAEIDALHAMVSQLITSMATLTK